MYFIIFVGLLLKLYQVSAGDEINRTITISDVVRQYGYPVEEHFITTDDGYILQLHRIPSTNNTIENKRTPILLLHGLAVSSICWVITGPKYALAFYLADNNYDVWMLNTRGTSYSTNHTTLSTISNDFWNYTWHEAGVHDIPKAVDYILEETSHKDLTVICHSQGCTSFYVMLAELPQYNKKIRAEISYAGAVYLCHGAMRMLNMVSQLEYYNMLTDLRLQIGDFNVAPRLPDLNNYLSNMCYSPTMNRICRFAYEQVAIGSMDHIDNDILHGILTHAPDGASVKSFIHYAQAINKCEFRRYRHSLSDPEVPYNIDNIKVPMYVFYGENDDIQHPKDTLLFGERSIGFQGLYKVKNWKHSDFVFSKYARKNVYEKTLSILNRL